MDDLKAILAGSTARDDKGRFSSVTPAEPEPVITETTPTPEPVKAVEAVKEVIAAKEPVESAKEIAYQKAMRDEREKRQALEAKLRELQSAPKEPVDPWADLPGAFQGQKAEFAEQLFVERCNLTEELARDRHKDYDEVRDVFLEAAKDNPSLMAQMRAERNPANFAYREGQRIQELKEVNGDFSAYRANLENKIRAEVEAKYAGRTAAVPASLNSDGSPAPAGEVYQGPPPLKEILRINKR